MGGGCRSRLFSTDERPTCGLSTWAKHHTGTLPALFARYCVQSMGELAAVMGMAPPESWSMFITDVRNSTEAIRNGKYKHVNIAGALCITAIINSEYYRKVPFIFGGDGVMFLVPSSSIELFSDSMRSVQRFTREMFSLDLRIGIVPMKVIYDASKQVSIGKLQFGHGGCMAIFEGDGIDFAEALVKATGSQYLLADPDAHEFEASFEGFSCPFADIPSDLGQVMALIIRPQKMQVMQISNELFQLIGDESSHHPLDAEHMALDRTKRNVDLNALIAAGRRFGFVHLAYKILTLGSMYLKSRNFMKKKISSHIKNLIIPASDYRKYDGSFKIVFRCDVDTQNAVIQWLEEGERCGNFLSGYHLTDRSLLTCLFNGKGDDRELHLIDATDGGYALAAQMLKKKLIRPPDITTL